MAEVATIARPYAEALFKVAVNGDLDGIAQQVAELAAVAGDAGLRQFADNPKADARQVFELVSGVVKTPLGDAMKNFLATVIDNGRLNAMPEIATQFLALKNQRSGVSDAVIESAFPIDAGPLAELVAVLEKKFARKLKASVTVVPELIGGVRVVVGDEVLDTSVRARLERMKVALTA